VPALRDGLLLGIGTEVTPGEQVPAERRFSATVGYLLVPLGPGDRVAPDQIYRTDRGAWRRLQDGEVPPTDSNSIYLHRVTKEYKRLEAGDAVKAGQVVGLIDPVLAVGELAVKLASLKGAEAERRASEKTKLEAERRMLAMEESNRKVPGSVSRDDYQGAVLTYHRYREEQIAKTAAVEKAQQELIQARAVADMHEIRATRPGTVKTVDREEGDVIKALETVLTEEVSRDRRPAAAKVGAEKVRDVRGKRDGVLVLFGTAVKAGEVVAPDRAVAVGDGAEAKRYRRLREGDTVEAGQLLARLDDRLARADVATKEVAVRAAEAEHRAAQNTKKEAERRVLLMEESNRRVPGSVSRDDYQQAAATLHRYREEEIAREAAVAVRQAELEQARVLLTAYEVRSPARGVVRELLKEPGEAVKAGEPVVRLGVPVP
jgi:multidrug efflux pump subunit AcrA (membrane-fusion protein)